MTLPGAPGTALQTKSLTHPQLTAVAADLRSAQARLHRLASATPDARWAARHDPGRWSIAECVVHLNLTSRAFEPLMTAALVEARRLNRPAPRRYRRDPIGWLASLLVGPRPRVGSLSFGRVRAPARFIPEGTLPRAEVLAEFDARQAQQIAFLGEADELAVDAVKVVSPFDGRVRYNLYASFVLIPRHQHRHLQQAEEVW